MIIGPLELLLKAQGGRARLVAGLLWESFWGNHGSYKGKPISEVGKGASTLGMCQILRRSVYSGLTMCHHLVTVTRKERCCALPKLLRPSNLQLSTFSRKRTKSRGVRISGVLSIVTKGRCGPDLVLVSSRSKDDI